MAQKSVENAGTGWARNARLVPGAVADWVRRFPSLPYVDDGATDRGRGTSVFDAVRRVETGSLSRFDWLSIKTAGIEGGRKLPSKLHLMTGNPETVSGLVTGIQNGAAYPTLVFASQTAEHGLCSPYGQVLFLDLAPYIREYGVVPITAYPEEGFDRGAAPPFYVRWGRWQPSGVKRHQAQQQAGAPDPGIVQRLHEYGGVEWAGGKVRYSQFVCSLAGLGVRRTDWANAHVDQLGAMLDQTVGFGGQSQVTWDNM